MNGLNVTYSVCGSSFFLGLRMTCRCLSFKASPSVLSPLLPTLYSIRAVLAPPACSIVDLVSDLPITEGLSSELDFLGCPIRPISTRLISSTRTDLFPPTPFIVDPIPNLKS